MRFQRKGASNNAEVGKKFESDIIKYFKRNIPNLKSPFSIPIGFIHKKNHKFDIGSIEQKVIIECKSHTWTESDNIPSAKLTTWDQAMLYFYLAPRGYRKIFVAKKDISKKRNKSLLQYYLETHKHVIPDEVEFWEFDEENKNKNKKFMKLKFDVTETFNNCNS